MTSIHEIATREPGPRPLCGSLLPFVMGDEGVLLVGIGFPQEAGHLVVTGADAFEQLFNATGGVADAEGFREQIGKGRRRRAAGRDRLSTRSRSPCGNWRRCV